jgi:hypothetical protein
MPLLHALLMRLRRPLQTLLVVACRMRRLEVIAMQIAMAVAIRCFVLLTAALTALLLLLQAHQLPQAWRLLWGVQLPAGRGAQRCGT